MIEREQALSGPGHTLSSTTLTGEVVFDPSDRIYADHFPGHPVVPGTLIVKAFLEAARRIETRRRPVSIKNVRFLQFVSPGQYFFRADHQGDRVHCELFDGENKLATGTVIL